VNFLPDETSETSVGWCGEEKWGEEREKREKLILCVIY